MRIGVLIPVFNAEDTIGETLDSVLNQSVLPYEICIVDDGSSDRTGEIIRDYAHNDQKQRIHWKIIQQSNQGLGAARNAALNVMTSEYVALLDADDTWTVDKVKHVQEFINQFPDTDLLYHPIWEWTGKGNRIRKRRDLPIESAEDIWLHNPITPSAVVLKRELDWTFDEDRKIHGVEDALLWTKAFQEKRVFRRMPNVDTYYRVGFGMTSNEEEHEEHVSNGLKKAIELGWLKGDMHEKLQMMRAYYRARNLHKNGVFDEAVKWYKKSEYTLKIRLLALAARLTIVV